MTKQYRINPTALSRHLLLILMILVFSGVQTLAFDASGISKTDLSKAKRNAGQYTKKIDQADAFLQKNNLSMAGKRLKSAEKLYDKIVDAYKAHPDLVADKNRFDVLNTKVMEALAVENLDKNIASYIKKVDEAQKYLDRKDTKNCNLFLEKADKLYLQIPDEHKTDDKVAKAFADYNAIKEKSGHSGNSNKADVASVASVDDAETYGLDKKQLRKAKQYEGRFSKKMAEAQRFFDEKKMYICEKRLIDANKLYLKIPAAYQNAPLVVETKKKYDEMEAVVSKSISAHKAGIEAKNQLLMASSGFGSEVRDLSGLLGYLDKGKNKKTNLSLNDLERFQKNFGYLDTFYDSMNGKYNNVLKERPEAEYEGYTVKEIYSLLENRIAYRDTLVKITVSNNLDAIIKGLQKNNDRILNQSVLTDGQMDDLFKDDYLSIFPSVNASKALCKWVGAPEPTEQINAIAAFQQKQKDSIKNVRKKLKFKKSDYSYNTSAMKKVAKANAERRNMKLIHIGIPSDSFHIVKNALGIPLYKTANGRGLYHVDGEDFYRGYDITVKKVYNGNGYDPVSSVKTAYTMTIYKK